MRGLKGDGDGRTAVAGPLVAVAPRIFIVVFFYYYYAQIIIIIIIRYFTTTTTGKVYGLMAVVVIVSVVCHAQMFQLTTRMLMLS